MGKDEDELKEKIRKTEEDNMIQKRKIDTKEFMSKREIIMTDSKQDGYM